MKYIFSLVLVMCSLSTSAQHMFNWDDIRTGKFSQKSVRGLRSMNDGLHYTVIEDNCIVKYSYKTGEKVEEILRISDWGQTNSSFADYVFSPDETKLLITTNRSPIYRHSYTADHWIYDIASDTMKQLTVDGGEQVPCFSPDGSMVGFVRDNDLYYVELAEYHYLTQVTCDGQSNHILNGHADWVYEEEYGFTRAFEFSADGNSIAYLKFDESRVKEYTMMYYTNRLYPEPYTFKYPKAGEDNSAVSLHLYSIREGSDVEIDTGDNKDQYIPRIGWTEDDDLFFFRVNRLQNHFEVVVRCDNGELKTIYDERDRRYVERPDDQTVTFLPKRRFVVLSESSGYKHLYVHHFDRGVLDTLTRGSFEVTRVIDVTADRVYFMSNEGSPLRNNLYSVRLNGKGKTKLTAEEGYYTVSPSAGFKYFISYFSNVSTPNIVRLHESSGKVIRVLEENERLRKMLADRKVPQKEFFTFTTIQGTVLNGYMIKPRSFDPTQKYPVMFTQYSGPGSQQVLDRWSIDWTDVLVQEGYIVICVDGRGTGGRGAEFRKCTYGNLGGLETEDQISAAKYLATMDYVDETRIGIYGWSFGGFMALNSILKGSNIFSLAIAVAPVTSWRYYDTIYTEIYNGLPQSNPTGYDSNSPVNYAEMLKGKLLIIHGSGDDNVHIENTYAMIDALVKAGKNFDVMIYPDDNHSMRPGGWNHIMKKMIDYTVENL